ncbi:hypothetical protein DMENIID0001_148250 [Sergentomyia squamirostris]
MKTVVFLLFILGIVDLAFSFQLDFPLIPDDIHWAGKTCAYELKPTPEQRLKWRTFDIRNSDDLTKCYVKCVLKYTSLYDPTTKIISRKAMKSQFIGRGLKDPSNLELLDGPTNGTCEDVFGKLEPFAIANMANFKKAFWVYPDGGDAKKWYEDNRGRVKEFGEKASDFCSKKYINKNCKKVDCAYQHYRLVDSAHRIITERNWNVYKINQDNLKKCQEEAAKIDQGSKKCMYAETLKKCMEKENKEEWEQFVKFLDDVSASYEYPEDPETSTG